jgi:RNA polymerase-binding transcription factor DksA
LSDASHAHHHPDHALYRSRLLGRRRELTSRLQAIETDFEQVRNPDDEDRAVERANNEVLEGLGAAGQKELLAIGAALDRIDHGSFGVCVRCGGSIDTVRLDAVPHTPLCRACAQAN